MKPTKIIDDSLRKFVGDKTFFNVSDYDYIYKSICLAFDKTHTNHEEQAIIASAGRDPKWDECFNFISMSIEVFQDHFKIRNNLFFLFHMDIYLPVVYKLNSRMLQVSREILTLLRMGYSDAAYARWRTLYEIQLSICILYSHKNDKSIFLQYIEHSQYGYFVSEVEPLIKYGKFPIEENIIEYAFIYDNLRNKYKDNDLFFRNEFGWSFKFNAKKEALKIPEIIKKYHKASYTMFYTKACKYTHADSIGIMNPMSINHEEVDVDLTKPYNFFEPSILLLTSLFEIESILLSWFPDNASSIIFNLLSQRKAQILQTLYKLEENDYELFTEGAE